MCNRYRMSAKQVELAQRFGIDPKLIMPEPTPLPPPGLFPKRIGWLCGMRTAAASWTLCAEASHRRPCASDERTQPLQPLLAIGA
jgi:hypothetical protein